MKRLSLALAALVVVAVFPHRTAIAAAASSIDGLWDAIVVARGTEVPFRFEIATQGERCPGLLLRRRPEGRIDGRARSPTAC